MHYFQNYSKIKNLSNFLKFAMRKNDIYSINFRFILNANHFLKSAILKSSKLFKNFQKLEKTLIFTNLQERLIFQLLFVLISMLIDIKKVQIKKIFTI